MSAPAFSDDVEHQLERWPAKARQRLVECLEDAASELQREFIQRAVAAGRVGAMTEHVFGLPTNRSQRTTIDRDCPDLVARLIADGADAALLVPNCPVCHQSVSLAARALEGEGIATVIMGCAKDIVEHAGVPRLLFSDFPLGNGAGRPHDIASQDATLGFALDLLEAAAGPRTTYSSPLSWSAEHGWKQDYCNAERLTPDEIAQRRKAFDDGKAADNCGEVRCDRDEPALGIAEGLIGDIADARRVGIVFHLARLPVAMAELCADGLLGGKNAEFRVIEVLHQQIVDGVLQFRNVMEHRDRLGLGAVVRFRLVHLRTPVG